MADSTRIEEIISERAVKAFDDLKLKVDASAASVEALVKRAVELNSALGGVKSPKDFNKSIQDIDSAERNLLNTVRSLNAEQAKLNDAAALQARKLAIQDEILAQKQLQTQIKANALEKQNQAAADKAAAAQRKVDLANENAAQQERNELLRQEQAEKERLTQQTEALDRAEEARLTNEATARSGVSGQQPGSAPAQAAFIPSTEIQKTAALLKSYQASLVNVRAEMTRLNAQLKSGAISQADYDRQINKLIIDEDRLKIAIASTQKSLTLANKENQFAKGTLEQRRIALERLTTSYANIAPIDRNTAASQRQLGIIQRLTAQVNLLEQEQGKFGRSVGNYATAANGFSRIGTAAGKAFGVVRQLAYILPGIGIAGIFSLALEPIQNFIEKLFGASEASKRHTAALEAEKEALDGMVESYRDRASLQDAAAGSTAAELAKVETLGKVLLDTTNSQKERNRALLDLQAINKVYFGDLTLEKDGLEAVKKALDEYNQAIILQAIIKEVESDIGKIGAAYFKQARAVKSATLELIGNEKQGRAEIANSKTRTFLLDKTADAGTRLAQNLKKQQDAAKPLADQYDQLQGFLKDLQLEALNFKPLTGGESAAKAQGAKLLAIKRDFDDQGAQSEADALKQISKNDDYYLANRIKNRERAYELEEDLRQRLLEFNLKAAKEERDATLNNEAGKKGGGDKNAIANAENKYQYEVEKIQKAAQARRVELAVQEVNDLLFIRNTFNLKRRTQDEADNKEAITQFKAQAAERKRLQEEEISNRLDRSLVNTESSNDIQLKIINDQANARIVAAKGNLNKIAVIEKKAAQDSLQAIINTEKLKIITLLDSQQERLKIAQSENNQTEVDKLLAKIADLRRQLSELNTRQLKLKLDVDTSGIDKFLSVLDKIKEKTMQVFDLIGGAVNASTIAQKNALQDQSDELERRAQKDIDTINASADSEEKKAARVQLVTAQTQAQKEVIAQRQRQLDQRQAEVDKARTIASIILDTAGAVAKQLKTTPLPAGLPFVAAIAALGAAQLAVAIATPIPRFEDGTLDAPGGLAQVNEKRKELVITPDGRLIETPGTPVVMNIPKHSIVLPDSRAVMERGIGRRELGQIRERNPEVAEVLGRKLDTLTRVIKNKTENHWQRKGDGWDLIKKSGNNTTRYL